MKKAMVAGLLAGGVAVAVAVTAWAQTARVEIAPDTVPAVAPAVASGSSVVKRTAAVQAVPAIPEPMPPSGGNVLMLRGLDKVTGRPTDILAPIGRQVAFATLTITARFCYSTPASETPETTAFVQIEDQRPDQPARKVFSGWMYASSPGLNPMDHPTYDIWVISCGNHGTPPPAVTAANAPVKVLSPDSSDKEAVQALPEDAGQ